MAMTKAQWKALYDYCDEYGCTRQEVLRELTANGSVERGTRLEDLGEYARDSSYDAMITFLEENL